MTKSEFFTSFVIARASSAVYGTPTQTLIDAEQFWERIYKEQEIERKARLVMFKNISGADPMNKTTT